MFLERALKDPMGRHYFMLDLHLLPDEVAGELQRLCNRFASNPQYVVNTNLTLMMDKTNNSSSLFKDLPKHTGVFDAEVVLVSIGARNTGGVSVEDYCKSHLNVQVVDSQRSGMGKSFYIQTEIKKQAKPSVTVIFSGDPSDSGVEKRLDVFRNLCRSRSSQENFIVHLKLDMMDNMESSCEMLDQLLFKFCYLRCVKYGDGYLYFDRVKTFYIEVQNSYRDLLFRSVSFLKLVQRRTIPKIPYQSELTKELKVEEWENGAQMMNTLCAFWNGIQSSDLGSTELFKLLERNHNYSKEDYAKTISGLLIMKTTNQTNVSSYRSLSNCTFSQIKALVQVLNYQSNEMDKVPGLSPSAYDQDITEANYQSYMADLKSSRLTTARSIAVLAVDLIWSVAESIRSESRDVADIIGRQKTKGTVSEAELDNYAEGVKRIPKWELADKINFFFSQRTLKVIYKKSSEVDVEIKKLIAYQTLKDIVNYGEMSQKDLDKALVVELVQALDLTIVKQANNAQSATPDREEMIVKDVEKRIGKFSEKGYLLTHDNYLKILMIFQRALLNIPIVIMGATGFGKTYMIRFIAECLMNEEFVCITLHAGISEDDLTQSFRQAVDLANQELKNNKRVWVLFDEFNTSPLQCLVSEIMIDRKSSYCEKLAGVEFPRNLIFIAACNPYRLEAKTTTVGLIHESSISMLSHRVYPIPDTMINNIWDFGQLNSETELQYINTMLEEKQKTCQF